MRSNDRTLARDDDLNLSYAQNGEDIVLSRGLTHPDGFYVDIGAFDPTVDSVTKLFYDRGWRGINADPVPEIMEAFHRDRPRDINVCAAISNTSGQAEFWTSPAELPGHSTLEEHVADGHQESGMDFTRRSVRTLRLDELLARYVPPGTVIDFLKIDVEGHERAVLESADWSAWRPRVVVVECFAPYVGGSTHHSWEPLLLDAGYVMVLFDGLNRFYVASEETELADRLGAPASVIDSFEKATVREMRHYIRRLESFTTAAEAELRGLREHITWLEQRLVDVAASRIGAGGTGIRDERARPPVAGDP